jgi:exosortase C (VPDSG-CTERM-specific)
MLLQESGINSRPAFRRQATLLAVVTGLLLLAFHRPCLQLLKFSLHDDLFSYIPLIPFISAYLIWSNKAPLALDLQPCRIGAGLFAAAGGALVAAYGMAARAGHPPQLQDYLAMMTLSLLCFFWGACLATVGSGIMRQVAFPATFLIFCAPLPVAWMDSIITFFQYASAGMAEIFLSLYGSSPILDGLTIHLPDFAMNVAPECSGIHSTMVLFMTGWIAGYMFLNRTWQRAVLIAIVIPLAILRNGFRIFVIGELCVHISHDMINSPIHRRGGPLFFALSLIPFFLFLVFLRKFNFNVAQPLKSEPQPCI